MSDSPDPAGPAPDPLLTRLRAALETLEAVAERRLRRDASRSDSEAEFAMMQDDRARLAVELDAALDAKRALNDANAAAIARVERAATLIEGWLGQSGG